MKKQIIIFAATIVPLAFFSCTKGTTEPQDVNKSVTPVEQKAGGISVANAVAGIAGKFEFNGTLKDKTGQLPDAVPTNPNVITYTTDRKGAPNKAIEFLGRYGMDVFNVPTQSNTSVAAWVKYASSVPFATPIAYSDHGPNLGQEMAAYYGVIITPITLGVASSAMDNKWHHLVATYDGNDLRFYVDGQYIGSANDPAQFPQSTTTYHLGYDTYPNDPHWRGCMDDLCFFNYTLSDNDVKRLYMQ